jgi:hypothetical protein
MRRDCIQRLEAREVMDDVEILVLVVLLFAIFIAILGMIISMIAFPKESSRVPPLPIKKQKGGIK